VTPSVQLLAKEPNVVGGFDSDNDNEMVASLQTEHRDSKPMQVIRPGLEYLRLVVQALVHLLMPMLRRIVHNDNHDTDSYFEPHFQLRQAQQIEEKTVGVRCTIVNLKPLQAPGQPTEQANSEHAQLVPLEQAKDDDCKQDMELVVAEASHSVAAGFVVVAGGQTTQRDSLSWSEPKVNKINEL
jgi:hypothetical protein